MCKRIILSSAITVLVSSVVLGSIGQFQTGGANANWVGGLGSGPGIISWGQGAGVVNDQSDFSVPIAWGIQHQAVGVGQGGIISGWGAPVLVGQHINGGGQQGQLIAGGSGPKLQGQSLGVVASQGIIKGIGLGSAIAGQGAIMTQSQTGGNAKGVMSESSTIVAGQSTNVAGLAGALAGGSIGVSSTQGQVDF